MSKRIESLQPLNHPKGEEFRFHEDNLKYDVIQIQDFNKTETILITKNLRKESNEYKRSSNSNLKEDTNLLLPSKLEKQCSQDRSLNELEPRVDFNYLMKCETEPVFSNKTILKSKIKKHKTIEEDSKNYVLLNQENPNLKTIIINTSFNQKLAHFNSSFSDFKHNSIGNESLLDSSKYISINNSDKKTNLIDKKMNLVDNNSLSNRKKEDVYEQHYKKAQSLNLRLQSNYNLAYKRPIPSQISNRTQLDSKFIKTNKNSEINLNELSLMSNSTRKNDTYSQNPFNKKLIKGSGTINRKQKFDTPVNCLKDENEHILENDKNLNVENEALMKLISIRSDSPLTSVLNKENLNPKDDFLLNCEKRSIDLNESNISEQISTYNNKKTTEFITTQMINDSINFENNLNLKIEQSRQFPTQNEKKKTNDLLGPKVKNDNTSNVENLEIINILDKLIKTESVSMTKNENIEDKSNVINKENNLINLPKNIVMDKFNLEKKTLENQEKLIQNDNINNMQVFEDQSNNSSKDVNKVEEDVKLIQIFGEINEFYRDLKESKKLIEDNLASLNKKINLNNLKNCDDFINEIDHDNKIDYNSRELLIKNLEKFRFDNVKEKLESLFLKYKNLGNISIDLKVFILKIRTAFPHLQEEMMKIGKNIVYLSH